MTPRLPIFKKGLLVILITFITGLVYAQQTRISDYVIFGGDGSCSSSKGHFKADKCLVEIGSKSKINGGAIGSFHFVKTNHAVTVHGNIFSGDQVYLDEKNSVTGKITAANSSSNQEASFKTGSHSSLKGNIDVNGSIYIGRGSKVQGVVTHPAYTRYNGPAPAGGNVTGTPSLPQLPEMPDISNFPDAGTTDIRKTESITPGSYGKINLRGDQTVTFCGSGIYVFSSIKNQGPTNTFIFDFKNNTSGVIKLLVHEDVELNKIHVKIINGGDASRIFTEVHGSGSTCGDKKTAWSMESADYREKRGSCWKGTVWAPYGGIRIGSSKGNSTVTGALLSGTKVEIGCNITIDFVPFNLCIPPAVDAGTDMELNLLAPTKLNGSSASQNATFHWHGLEGAQIVSGENSPTAEVSTAGTYVLTATTGPGCTASDTVLVIGKSANLIGSELTSLYTSNDMISELSKSIFLIQNDSVYIEVITFADQYYSVLTLLQYPEYGLTDIITNGESKLIITGKFPIANLDKLNYLTEYINFCRPLYPPLTNSGIVKTEGDIAIRTNFVRNSFGVKGEGIMVGVLSDSYNTLPGNPAQNDVVNGDLPGNGNPVNPNPVRMLKEYPYGQRTDEGRAMLQIVHDVAPAASLTFRTGFISPGDFAVGIKELADEGCNIIVDDVTFITEPFFQRGAIDSAITDVTGTGVVYITAAGNFGEKSYGSVFNPADAPAGITGKAHNFGGGDILQNDSLKGSPENPGIYTLVLQWVDDIYSLSGSGTQNDLDIYLADDAGNPILGYNRNNIGGDPIEVLPFSVTENTVANIMIINTSPNPSPNLRFKYVVFRGDFKINEFPSETSTIVGHGNAPEAITVGAARYSETPAFGSNEVRRETFSSAGGGILANGVVSQKPDLIGPDGVNTTISFGNIDLENDGLPNFFGTSAAAPHVAGAAALLLQAGKKYYDESLSPQQVKTTFQNTALDMETPGFDFNTGYGFIQADAALRTIANPSPQIDSVTFTDASITPGSRPLEAFVHGNYFTRDTKILFGTDTLSAIINSNTLATVVLPVFYSDQFISAYTPAITPSALDGGVSNSITINGIPKKNITVIANNKTQKYGTVLPEFTATILVNDDSLHLTGLSELDLGLVQINYQTPAKELSDVGIYYIRPSVAFDENDPEDKALLDKYNYSFIDGALTVSKLPLKISVRDTTLLYGQIAGDFKFNYIFDSTANINDPAALLSTVKTTHQEQLAPDIIGLVNGQAVVIVNGQAIQIVNGQAVQLVDGQAVTIVNGQAVPIVNSQAIQIVNGQAIQIVNNLTESQVSNLNFLATASSLQQTRQLKTVVMKNGVPQEQSMSVLDITQESILKFNTNSAQTILQNSVSEAEPKGLVDVVSYTNGQAIQIVNGQAIQIINGQAIQIVNGQAVQIINGQAVTIVNGEPVPIVNSVNKTAVIINAADIGHENLEFKAINIVTGLDAGDQFILPATYSNNNFDISYEAGKLNILPAPLSIKTGDTTKTYGAELTLDSNSFTIVSGNLMYIDSILSVSASSEGTTGNALPGTYPIKPQQVILKDNRPISNYDITFLNGTLSVEKLIVTIKADDVTKVYGDPNPIFTASYVGLLNGETPESAGITGSPSFWTPAKSTSDAGYYEIVAGPGTLSSEKYDFRFEKGKLSVTPAPLYVKADDKVMYQYGFTPKFTAQIKGLKAGERPHVTFSTDSSYSGQPGVYSIIPQVSFPKAANYQIHYTNGNLYVNPKCGNARALRVKLKCIEKVSTGKYIAHFYCVNENATTLYIPAGLNNFVFSFGLYDARNIPVIFTPGTTEFNIPFDGMPLTWIVSSYEKCWHLPSVCIAGFGSPVCKIDKPKTFQKSMTPVTGEDNEPEDRVSVIELKKGSVQDKQQGVLRIYPNPVQNTATVYLSNEIISAGESALYDVNGKLHPLKLVRQISPNSFEIDMSHLQKGSYILRVKVSKGYVSITVVKG